jgi:hypothetical protein
VGGSGVSVTVIVGVKVGIATLVGSVVPQEIKKASNKMAPPSWKNILRFCDLMRMVNSV